MALLFKTASTRTIRCTLSNWLIDALHLLQLSLMNAIGTGTKFLCSFYGGSCESPFLDVQPLYTTTISYLANALLHDQILMCSGARNNKVSLCFNKN